MRKRSLLLLAGAARDRREPRHRPSSNSRPGARCRRGRSCSFTTRSRRNLRPGLGRQILYATSLVDNSIFLGGQIYNNNANWVTRLFTGPPKILKKSPLTTQFTFSPKADWCDGKPVTCADWRATWQILINPANNAGEPERIRGHQVGQLQGQDRRSSCSRGPTRTGRRSSNERRLPGQHVAGKDMNQMFNNSIPVSDGPWKFQSWQKGVQITVVKNPKFTIAPMKLDRVVFRYILTRTPASRP